MSAGRRPAWRRRLAGAFRTWRAKLLLLLLAFAVLPLVVQSGWDYLATRRAFETSAPYWR